jgi:hypothetical protein
MRIVQQNAEFLELLSQLQSEWVADAFIHADAKWENCLLVSNGSSSALKLIDWELGGIGDSAWDVGSILAAYLSFWLLNSPITPRSIPDEILRDAQYPLESMQPAMRSFWKSYMRGVDPASTVGKGFQLRAIRYAAAQLLQSAFEQLQLAPEMTGYAVCALQVSLNILKRPRDAAVALVGLDEFR